MLLDSEFSLKKIEETRPEVTCSEDLEKIKNSVSNLEHSTEAIRSFINSLQSEAKLLKDPNSVENTKSNVNIRFSNLMNKFKEYYKVLDAVTIKWQKVDKEISAIENFIEKCSLLTTTGNLEPGGLPGDQQKLKFELETLEKYNNSILTQKNNIDDLTETMNEISLLLPIDYDMTYNKIEKMRQKLIELPKQLVERNRIVTSALESHVIYSEAVEIFTLWLISFERLLRQNTNICLDDVTEAKQQTEIQRNEINRHQTKYQEIASHLNDLRTMCNPKERNILVTRYTECTKFLSRVCEVVSSREEAVERVESFSLILIPLLSKLDIIEKSLARQNIMSSSDDINEIKEELEQIDALIQSLKNSGTGLDEILLHAQLTSYIIGNVTSHQKQRTTVRGLINRVKARYDVINGDIYIKKENYEEVERMWTNFLCKKDKLLKEIEKIEEVAESEILIEELEQETIKNILKQYEKLQEQLNTKKYEATALENKGNQIIETDSSQENLVKGIF